MGAGGAGRGGHFLRPHHPEAKEAASRGSCQSWMAGCRSSARGGSGQAEPPAPGGADAARQALARAAQGEVQHRVRAGTAAHPQEDSVDRLRTLESTAVSYLRRFSSYNTRPSWRPSGHFPAGGGLPPQGCRGGRDRAPESAREPAAHAPSKCRPARRHPPNTEKIKAPRGSGTTACSAGSLVISDATGGGPSGACVTARGLHTQCLLMSFLFYFSFGEKMGTNHLVQGHKVGPGEQTTVFKSSFIGKCCQVFVLFCFYGIDDIEWSGVTKKVPNV